MNASQDRERASPSLTHIGAEGEARMVDVSAKPETARVAVAEGAVRMDRATLAAILAGDAKKGDVIGAARIAGIMGAKRTSELIPLCHPIQLSKVVVDIAPDETLPGFASGRRRAASARPGRDGGARPPSPSPASPFTTWRRRSTAA